jgi:2-oxoisovalerate dehydrogenase E2 component (dihydrolipoyl transacylase)
MGVFTIKVPDVGEGIAEAELAEWEVAVGDLVREDQVFAAVMTDKATVEIPSSVAGKVLWLGGAVGDTIAIGADLIRIEVEGKGNAAQSGGADAVADDDTGASEASEACEASGAPENTVTSGASEASEGSERPEASEASAASETSDTSEARETRETAQKPAAANPAPQPGAAAPASPKPAPQKRKEGQKPLASPAVRLRARQNGVDLRHIHGSGPAGVITHADLDAYFDSGGDPQPGRGRVARTAVREVRITGLRRKIAERMSLASSRIPHITIVEEIDVTGLEDLRGQLNTEKAGDKPKLTVLPFLIGAMVKALAQQPALNARFDDEAGIVTEFDAVHVGIAAQTPNGLMVPVVRHCEAMSIWDTAAEVARMSDAAKSGTASRAELSGSTITITSLGALGALATTPIINHPEVAIVGVNRMAVRPMWNGTDFVPRKMMNISCSFDHRVVDGWDAAVFVKRLKTLLETPAMIFLED